MRGSGNDALDSRGYSSTPINDEEEWNRLRGLSEKETAEGQATARHRRKNLLVLLVLAGLFAFVVSQPLLLPDRLLGTIALSAQDTWESIFPGDSGPTIPASPVEETPAGPDKPKGEGRHVAAGGSLSPGSLPAQPGSAAPASQSPPFAGGVQVAHEDPLKPPFGVEIVDSRDRRYAPAPTERVINLTEKGTTQRVEVDPKVSDRMRITPGPVISKEANVNGTVKLRAVISTDGAIKELAVVSGPAELGPAAVQVARQWRYRPYYFNGRPVETETFITVNFNISTN